MDKQPIYYTYRVALLLGLLAIGVFIFLFAQMLWLQLLDAVYLAFVFAQIGLLSHEAGHRQMFTRSWKHDLLGLVGGNLLIGMSYAWWLDKHNKHHSHPNQVDMDPDIEIPLLEFTGMEDVKHMGPPRQFLVKHQALLFFPALMTVAADLQYKSIAFLLHQKARYKRLEWLLVIAHYVLYFAFVFSHVSLWSGILFIAIHQALTGFYLGSIFAPNHKGMPVLEKGSQISFLHRQVMTSRNIHAHPLTDFLYGGLNYQIEHHLFPSMPRNKLKEAQHIVKTFCQERAIPYHETGIIQSFQEILQHLYQIGAPLRRA
ncbi:delta fatty acid desaturase [Ktedonospora formicarum]|uniref:Delta fatty acid desaturase n=1 Tax=Ktedonospora formicarum TaxID=2778364 RepID=A0A8J3I0E8_9CHLR|nr:delta fatty acid desaturase [Ktedonospora formicarum]